jgi:ureidoacrylate peracid hydrolase
MNARAYAASSHRARNWVPSCLVDRKDQRAGSGVCDDRAMLVTIEAKPEPFAIDPRETALIAVDMQNDFGAVGGMFASKGLPITAARATIEPTARVLAAARAAGMTVVYLKMEFTRDLSNLGGPDAPNRERHLGFGVGAGDFLIEGTWNTDIVPELAPEPGDVLVSKQRYSGFFQTELDDVLRGRDIKSLVFVGWKTSVCVESTLRDAFFRDYRCVVLSDCTAEVVGGDLVRTNHDASLLVIEGLFGWVADSQSLLQALAQTSVQTAAR